MITEFQGSSRQDLLSLGDDLGHLAHDDFESQVGRSEREKRPVQDLGQGPREVDVPDRVRSRPVDRAFCVGIIERQEIQADNVVDMNPA